MFTILQGIMFYITMYVVSCKFKEKMDEKTEK